MKNLFWVVLFVFCNLQYSFAEGKFLKFQPAQSAFNFSDLKHRIFQPPLATRNCCAFGYNAQIKFFPAIKITQIVGIGDLTHHSYANNRRGKKEQQGEMFSCHAGFLDTGHIRHAVDWTAYLAVLLENYLGKTERSFNLLKEGGKRTLTLYPVDEKLSKENIVTIAQRIAYDTTVWHEILTWYSPSVVPIFSEKHSSFAPEDNFSNLLGTYIARDTLLSQRPFNIAAHEFTIKYLTEYATQSREKTFEAFDWVENDLFPESSWWSRRVKMPNWWAVTKRHLDAYPTVTPWQVGGREYLGCEVQKAPTLVVPEYITTPSGRQLKIAELYKLEIAPNKKVPVTTLTGREDSVITHHDFPYAIEQVKASMIEEFLQNGFSDPTVID